MALSGTQAGELTESSCQLSDGSNVAEYLLTVPVRGTLQATAKATGFSPSILIRDLQGRKVESGATVQRYLESGTYHVLLNGIGAGKFSLTTAFTPEPSVLCANFERLGAGGKAEGQLSASSCKLPDGSLFEGWQMTVYGAGTLTITMKAGALNSSLLLRNESGNLLASDDNGGGTRDAQISLPVSGRETYTILAASANSASKGGAYQLSSTFEPNEEESCRPVRVLTESSQFSGSISAASCNFNLPDRQDSSLFNFYNIHLTQSATVAISVPAASFTPLLLLLDQNGNSLTEDSESGGLYTPLIKQQLPAGDYSVLIFNEDSFDGDYTLQYNVSPALAQPCPVQTLESGRPVSGEIVGDSSCRRAELLSDAYRFTLPATSTVSADLSSGDFTTFMELRDAKDNLLAYSDNSASGQTAHLQLDLPAGSYVLNTASVDLPGRYSLLAQLMPKTLPACAAPQNIAVNTGFIGVLGASNCLGPAGEPVDYYRFTLPSSGTVALVTTSGDLDSYLSLTDASGKVLRFDDNSYADGDAIIVQYLAAGTYRLEARGRNIVGSGRYRVDLLWTAGPKPLFCGAAPLAIGAAKDPSLTYTACQYYDNTFADTYSIQVSDPTKPVDIFASSALIDSYLILMDSKGNMIASDDNSGGGTAARLTLLLDPGTYYVVFKPAADPRESGIYHIQIQQ